MYAELNLVLNLTYFSAYVSSAPLPTPILSQVTNSGISLTQLEVWNREFEQTKVKKKNKNKKYHKGGPETTDPENPARSFLIN